MNIHIIIYIYVYKHYINTYIFFPLGMQRPSRDSAYFGCTKFISVPRIIFAVVQRVVWSHVDSSKRLRNQQNHVIVGVDVGHVHRKLARNLGYRTAKSTWITFENCSIESLSWSTAHLQRWGECFWNPEALQVFQDIWSTSRRNCRQQQFRFGRNGVPVSLLDVYRKYCTCRLSNHRKDAKVE